VREARSEERPAAVDEPPRDEADEEDDE